MRIVEHAWFALLVICCGGCDPDFELLHDPSELAERREERRERMNIRVQPVDDDGNPVGEVIEDAPESFAAKVHSDCAQTVWTETCSTASTGLSCFDAACAAQYDLCAAHRLLEIMQSPLPINIDHLQLVPGGGPAINTYQVHPPTAEAQAALAELAFDRAAAAVLAAGAELRAVVGLPSLGAGAKCTGPDDIARSRFGDDDDSPTLDPVACASRSRAHRRPRDSELFGFWGEGICPVTDLDDDARAALQLLRESGVDPELVLDGSVSLAVFLEGPARDRAEGVGPRLAERLGRPELALWRLSATSCEG